MDDVIKLSSPATREFWELAILYEDAQLLAVAKPAGLLGSPDRYNAQRPNLMQLMHQAIARGAPWSKARGLAYLANAHRLDFETSGVFLLVKDKASLIGLANQFGSHQPVKTYVALVQGSPRDAAFDLEAPLGPHPARAGAMHIDRRLGKPAFTHFEVQESFRGHTQLKCQPKTERAHQIRVHLQSLGYPIVGDSFYGGRPLLLSRLKPQYRFKEKHEERPLIGRVALHAEQLTIRQPATQAEITIQAPWPKDLTVAIKYLRRYSTVAYEPDFPPGIPPSEPVN